LSRIKALPLRGSRKAAQRVPKIVLGPRVRRPESQFARNRLQQNWHVCGRHVWSSLLCGWLWVWLVMLPTVAGFLFALYLALAESFVW